MYDQIGPFYVVGISSSEVGTGTLSRITSAITDLAFKSGSDALKNKASNPRQVWASIYMENSLFTMSNVKSKYQEIGFDTVLYINKVAWNILEDSDFELNLVETIDQLPNTTIGNYLSMPYWQI